jgi:hypothetical protein
MPDPTFRAQLEALCARHDQGAVARGPLSDWFRRVGLPPRSGRPHPPQLAGSTPATKSTRNPAFG